MKHITVFILAFFLVIQSNAQVFNTKKGSAFSKDEKAQAIFEEGEFWFDLGNYDRALAEYQKILIIYPEEPVLLLKSGICYLYQADGYEKALANFSKVDKSAFRKTDFTFYHGKALHLNLKFDEAIEEFNEFIKNKGGTKAQREEAKKYIVYCQNGKELVKKSVEVKIENIGAPINTVNSEYVPLITSDGQQMLFTYRGERSIGGMQDLPDAKGNHHMEYYEDVMITKKDSAGNWIEPQLLPETVNTEGNDACVAFANDGRFFYMFRSINNDLGTIFRSEHVDTSWTEPAKLEGDINSKFWEGSFTISADGQVAYFSSERPGGKGGRDLYQATLQPDGKWGKIKNLEGLNTPEDDDAPFIHPSGLYLVFSSKGHNSMGGYDIFRATLEHDTIWNNAVNLGYPINTPGDDVFYVVAADGTHGYYSSGKIGGMGAQDIYLVTPGMPDIKIPMVQVKGSVTLNDKPVKSDIQVTFTNTGRVQGNYANVANTGEYLIDFPAGRQYSIMYKLEGYQPQLRALDAQDVDEFFQVNYDVNFYSDTYLEQIKRKQDSLNALTVINNPPVKVDTGHVSIIQQYGALEKEGLDFRVQIGAYNLPQNFNYASVLKIGKVEKLKLDDNVTRFVMGKFKNYNDAAAYRNKVIKAGITDAFVSGIYQGKRYMLIDLVNMGILVK